MWFQTEPPDPHHVVASTMRGYWYHCPDVAAVDRHLVELRAQLAPISNMTERRKGFTRTDIDRLLEERAFLELYEPAPRQACEHCGDDGHIWCTELPDEWGGALAS